MSTPVPPRRCRIEQWAVHSEPYAAPEVARTYLSGEVYGYPGRQDGHRVTTGHIYGAAGRLAWGRRTAYELGEPSPDYLRWLAEHGLPFDPDAPIKLVTRLTVPCARLREDA